MSEFADFGPVAVEVGEILPFVDVELWGNVGQVWIRGNQLVKRIGITLHRTCFVQDEEKRKTERSSSNRN